MQPKRRKKIVVFGINYSPELVGIAVYTAGLAEELASRGWDVEVICGKPYYPNWTVPPKFRGRWARRSTERDVSVTRVAHYVPSNPTGILRIAHHFSFALSSIIPMLVTSFRQRPDVIFTVAPSLIASPVAWIASVVFHAKSWLHVQDLEVDAAFATGLLRKSGAISAMAYKFERLILRRFDMVSSISPNMCRACVEKGLNPQRVVEFRNWADLDSIKPLIGESAFRTKWGIKTPYVVLYSGNIANKQGIDIVIEAAKRLCHREDITFVICGNGPNRQNLARLAAGIPGIRLFDLQPTEELDQLLGLATIHVLPQLGSAADLVLPSKLTNILASGRALVATAEQGTSLQMEVEGCGIVVPPGDEAAFAAAIEKLLDDNVLRNELARNSRRKAELVWSKKRNIEILVKHIEILLGCKETSESSIRGKSSTNIGV